MEVPLLLWAAGRAQHRVVQPLVLGAAVGSAGLSQAFAALSGK